MDTPEEQTWRELQDNLRRTRKQYTSVKTRNNQPMQQPRGKRSEDYIYHRPTRHRKHTPKVLPKLTHRSAAAVLPETPPTLRGSHYPVIPPLSADSDHSLSHYGVDIFDQNVDYPASSPLPYYSTHPPYNGTFQNGYQNNRYHQKDSLQDGGVSRYSDLIYDVQYGQELQDRRHDPRLRDGKKQKYLLRPNRLAAENLRYSDSPDYDIWRNKRWQQQEVVEDDEPYQRLAWKESEEDGRGEVILDGRVVVNEHRKTLRMLQWLEAGKNASGFMDYFLQDFLEHEMVLDVVCQVLVEQREKAHMSPRSFQFQEVQTKQEQKARMKHQSIWLDLIYRPDIYEDITMSLVRETVGEECALLVRESIMEMVDGYFYQKALFREGQVIFNEVVQDLLPDVAIESSKESFEESFVNDIIDGEIQGCIQSFLEEAFATGTLRLPLTLQEQSNQQGQVEKLASHMLIDSLCLDHLLQTITNNGKVWNEEEHIASFLDGRLLDTLLAQYLTIVHRRNITACCIPLKRQHERIYTQVALDVILEDLTGHLDEDMHSLFDYEVAVDHAQLEDYM